MSLPFGTEVPNPLALAAVDDVEATRQISQIMADEAHATGINWSLTPVHRHQRRVPQRDRRNPRLRQRRRRDRELHARADRRVPEGGRRGDGEALARRRIRRPRPAPRHDHQSAVARGLGGDVRPALSRRDRGRRAVGDERAHRLPGVRSLARSEGGRRGVPAGLDQQGAQPDAAARKARVQRRHRFRCDLHGRARRLGTAARRRSPRSSRTAATSSSFPPTPNATSRRSRRRSRMDG